MVSSEEFAEAWRRFQEASPTAADYGAAIARAAGYHSVVAHDVTLATEAATEATRILGELLPDDQ